VLTFLLAHVAVHGVPFVLYGGSFTLGAA